MPAADPKKALESFYQEALARPKTSKRPNLPPKEVIMLDVVLRHAETSKGVLTVLLTSILYKHLHSAQDVRLHQHNMKGGYSGRTFDTRYVTPFLKSKHFPAMAESGWLTRSLEQNNPYMLNYRGSIRPQALKDAFLGSLDKLQRGASPRDYALHLLRGLIARRDSQLIQLARPAQLPISAILGYLNEHFSTRYSAHGAARLPVLAVQAVYVCVTKEMSRYKGKSLLPLESHTSADTRSGRIGDIQLNDATGKPVEGAEIKHGIAITAQLVKDASRKIAAEQVGRYYILSTAGASPADRDAIAREIEDLRSSHGCQLIVDDVMSVLSRYLRLLSDPADFIKAYVDGLESDSVIKFEHRAKWNQIVAGSETL